MSLLNYSTTVPAAKTVAQIQTILAKHGAIAILTNYDSEGQVESLSFKVKTSHGELPIRLPIDIDATLRVLERQAPRRYCNREQAVKVSWRIIKDWVEAQLAILETEMVRMEQIFLPYVVTNDGRTLFSRMVESKFLLTQGSEG